MNNKVYIIAGIACLISIAHGINQKFYNNKLEFLLETYKVESRIQSAQVLDLTNTLSTMKNLEYQKGFEQGRNQMGIAFLNNKNMYDYADGYHAATSQFGSDQFEEFKEQQKLRVERYLMKEVAKESGIEGEEVPTGKIEK